MTLMTDPRVPDGSLPLEVGKTGPLLEPTVANAELLCFIAAHGRRYGLAVPEDCHDRIRPGEHYMRHLGRDGTTGDPSGLVWNYCAPCAVRELAWWNVHEASSA